MANKLTKNFTIEEFTASPTASKLKIDNTVPEKYKENLQSIAELMQKIRDKWGAPIIVSSGYRCPKLNKAINGANTSQHMTAAACDFHTVTDKESDNMNLWRMIISMIKLGEIKCRQCIFEYGHKNIGPSWIHIAVQDSEHKYKENEILYLGCK